MTLDSVFTSIPNLRSKLNPMRTKTKIGSIVCSIINQKTMTKPLFAKEIKKCCLLLYTLPKKKSKRKPNKAFSCKEITYEVERRKLGTAVEIINGC